MENPLELTYTRFGFERKSHKAQKVGDWSNVWAGEILLSTTQPVPDEIEAQRDLEVLVLTGALPMLGYCWLLAGVSFSWIPTSEEIELLGADTRCIVRINYRSTVDPITPSEFQSRAAFAASSEGV